MDSDEKQVDPSIEGRSSVGRRSSASAGTPIETEIIVDRNGAGAQLSDLDDYYMGLALEQARCAGSQDEVPIGAVVVHEGRVIATGYNRREIDNDPAGHAEFIAMKVAARERNAWRLSGCTVYVTLEPCLMCAGLMYQARIDRCVYGASDPKAGALGSLYSINSDERLNHSFAVTSGVRANECGELLRDFFREKRARNKKRKHQARIEDDLCES